jgi:nitrogen regulatory protein P-II 1
MSVKRITAIVPIEILQSLEKFMRDCGVPGITVETVHGYGEHPNYYRKDLMKENAKLILYTVDEKVDEVIETMSACARESGFEHGIIAIDSVDRLVHLSDGTDVSPASLRT